MQGVHQPALTTKTSEHLVQFYDADHAAWAKSVGRFLKDGLNQGEAVLVIATPEHEKPIARQLNASRSLGDGARHKGRVAFFDAAETLAKFMLGWRTGPGSI
jgi:hypothetical protein